MIILIVSLIAVVSVLLALISLKKQSNLKELKEAGLIRGEVDGTKSCYCIDWENLEKMHEQFNEFYDKLGKRRSKN